MRAMLGAHPDAAPVISATLSSSRIAGLPFSDDGNLPPQFAGEQVLRIIAWTPRTMSTTWVTRKLTATLHNA